MTARYRETIVTQAPTTPAELRVFVERAFGVTVPDVQVCSNHSTPWRAFCDAYFATAPASVWKGSRGFGGKTFLLSLLAACEAVLLKADVNILGGSGQQSKNALAYVQRFIGGSNIVAGAEADSIGQETRLRNGATVRALLASQASVRGPHPPRLRLDEVDEMRADIFDAAAGQPMSKPGVKSHMLASSTHQYPDGTMTRTLKLAAERGWPIHEWCWRETSAPGGWLTLEEIESKRAQVTAAMWAVEYDMQEPSVEGRAILPSSVAAMFSTELGEYDGKPGARIEIEAPQPGATYATGADWARKLDFTDIITLRTDLKPMRLVAHERFLRAEWPHMIDRFAVRVRRYPGTSAHDATGLGDVVDAQLREQGVATDGVMLVGRERRDLFAEYIAAIERGEIEAPFIRSVESEHRTCAMDDLYGAGHPPDSFVAGAMAYRASRRGAPAAAVAIDTGVSRAQHGARGGLFGSRR